MASPESLTPFDDSANASAPPWDPDGFPSDALPETVHDRPAPLAEPETMVDCIRRFIRVQARLKEIETEEKVLKREERELSDRVIEMMIEQGMDSPPGVDGMTAYVSPVHFVTKKINPETGEEFTADDIRDALVASGLKAMIKESYHGGQLRSTLKEYVDHGVIPDALAKVVELDKRRELRITPMAAKKRSAAPRS